jgi:hypothetical protein
LFIDEATFNKNGILKNSEYIMTKKWEYKNSLFLWFFPTIFLCFFITVFMEIFR